MEEIGAFASKKSYLLLVQIVVGWLIGAGIILYRYNATSQSERYFETASFSIWLMLMGLLVGLLPVLGAPLWGSLRKFNINWQEHRFNLIMSSVLLFVLVMAPIPFAIYIAEIPFPLYGHIVKMVIIFILTYFSVLPGGIGLWLTNYALSEAYQQIEPTIEACYPYVEKARNYYQNMQLYLTVAGVMISLVVLTTVALRDALVQYDSAIASIFTIEMVLAFGLYFTFVLGLIYIPTYSILQFQGRELRDWLYPINTLSDYIDKGEDREKFEEILNLRVGIVQNLRSSVFILAPLLTSFLSSLLDI